MHLIGTFSVTGKGENRDGYFDRLPSMNTIAWISKHLQANVVELHEVTMLYNDVNSCACMLPY